ncbi:YfhO family protein [Vagococcus zengguangii]|uniref:Membrane protein 6-pyruvoyl-tetrahydropterin synthase-related domain-containing protein n=1 Tax=Vagococcus zengguangii TaxID=2571750 RepID=A0A4D7CYZ1_9ENTE|nr:YfhO family protein [Vagococcus zengguangii]QCI87030.1 hypothetical protein FA707_08655 [Vagococcus zengguangii]
MIISFIVVTVLSSQHLFSGGYTVIKSPDFYFHFNRFLGVIESLAAGQGLSRINTLFLEGWGYGSPMFYGDYLLVIGFVFYKLGFTALTSYKLYLMTLTFLCLLIPYYCSRPVVKNKTIAYFIALLYALATFRMYDLFVRNALGEATAFLFIPLVVLGMWSIKTEKAPRWYYLALGMTGLLVTHLLTTILVTIALAIMVIVDNKAFIRKWDAFSALVKATLLTVGLSAFFTLPMLEQLKLVPMRINTDPILQRSMFLTDFGKLLEQSLDNVALYSANIGILLLIPIVLRFFVKRDEQNMARLKLADYTLVIGIITLLSATSLLPWELLFNLSFLSVIQFPFRWLIITTMMLAISGGIYFYEWSRLFANAQVVRVFMVLGILLSTMSYNQAVRLAEGEKVVNETAYQPYQIGTGQEYLPVATNRDWLKEQAGKIRYNQADIRITNSKINHTTIRFDYRDAKNAEVALPLLNYPGYQALEVATGRKLSLKIGAHYELMLQGLQGTGKVEVSYQGTFIQKVGLAISIGTLVLSGYLVYYQRKTR